MQIVADDLLINYEITGKGRNVLLLHGWADSIKGIKPLTDQLSKKYRVIAIDLPGFGGSQLPTKAFNLLNYAETIQAFLKKIEVEKLHLVLGHSNGGAIAIKAISNQLITTEKLILLASAGIRKSKNNLAIEVLTKTGKIISYPLPKNLKTKMRNKLYKSIKSDLLARPGMEETFKLIIREDVQSDLAKIEIPTLLLYADDDDQTPFTYGEVFHQLLKNSTLEILHGGGHFVGHNNPKLILERIEKFDQ